MRLTITHRRSRTATLAAAAVLLSVTISAQQPAAPHAVRRDRADAVAADTRPDDPFATRGWNLELTGTAALEAWNYNISHEEMYGFTAGLTYGLGKGIVFIAGSPLYYVSQRGIDGYLFGGTFGVRGRVYRRQRVSVFLETQVGISESDTEVPPRGTRFNYLVLGAAGATVRLRHAVHVMAGLRWIHVSNNGLAGRDRNPDIEAIGPTLGVLVGF